RTADSYRRIRNTARYLLANLAGFDPARDLLKPADMLALDRWALNRARSLHQDVVAAYDGFTFHVIYQRLHQFCAVDLGAFYLDVLKDRVYTARADSRARRSAQTAMYHILEALTRWMAPILSFTAEEIWRHLPGPRGDSVFLETWYRIPDDLPDELTGEAFWGQVLTVREQVARELERLRVADTIGGSLDAEVDLYCEPDLHTQLNRLEDELRFVFITSYARLHLFSAGAQVPLVAAMYGLKVEAKPSTHAKCVRCWHHRADVGAHAAHPQLCGRCVENVDGAGETRNYA
ncbi:MAG: class I tRNA ligase family protein, partial [Gammaproteobacteria bacterium]|nr:class I tRNA ligase family protein [Gammaproteobacteria bacterium]